MKFKTILAILLVVFCSPCVILAAEETPSMQPAPQPVFSAAGGSPKTITLGSLDANTGFKFQVDFTSRGAGISDAKFSEFDNLDKKIPSRLRYYRPQPISTAHLLLQWRHA